jgi:hypothetical protein
MERGSPEPMNTDFDGDAQGSNINLEMAVFMGSGFASATRPGMTAVGYGRHRP